MGQENDEIVDFNIENGHKQPYTHTKEQQWVLNDGLRILAKIIARDILKKRAMLWEKCDEKKE